VNRNLKAVIFDLDGVLCSTSRLHAEAWRRVVRELGIEPPPDLEDAVRGISRMASLRLALGRHANDFSQEELEELAERKNRYYLAALGGFGPGDAFPGSVELLDALRAGGVRVALASASRNARQVIQALGISARFDAVADGTSYRFGKPHPDIFLTAAAMIGARPEDCVVVEDAAAGIDAALDGGFVALGLGKEDLLFHAHAVVPDLRAVSVPMLRSLHGQFRPDRWTLTEDLPKFQSERSSAERLAARSSHVIVPAVFHFAPQLPDGGEIRALAVSDANTPRALASSDSARTARQIEGVDFFGGRLLVNGQPIFADSPESRGIWRLDMLHGSQTLAIEQAVKDGARISLVQQTFADMTYPGRFLARYAIEPTDFSGKLEMEIGLKIREASNDPMFDMAPLRESVGSPVRHCVRLAVRCAESLFVAAASCLMPPDGAEVVEKFRQSPGGLCQGICVALERNRLAEFERVCAVAASSDRESAIGCVLEAVRDAIACRPQVLRRMTRARTRQVWQRKRPDFSGTAGVTHVSAQDYRSLFGEEHP